MGVLPEREWIMRAPTLRRKLALTAKVQDEVGHAQMLYRVAEDLGKPREAMFDDLLAGKTKFHNVFHYPTYSWADIGVIAWLVDAAAIVAQQALRDSSYAPYARTMKKICWEESVHIMHGRDVVVMMVTGTAASARNSGGARSLVGAADANARPAERAREGPRHPLADQAKTSEELRQEFLTIYVPRIQELGLTIPDADLVLDDATGIWAYGEPDWNELRTSSPPWPEVRRAPRLPPRTTARRRSGSATRFWVRHAPSQRRPPEMTDQRPRTATWTPRPMATAERSSRGEVFRREKDGDPMRHGGSVMAPDAVLAVHYARELYGRRQESVALWVVRRADIHGPRRPGPPPAAARSSFRSRAAT